MKAPSIAIHTFLSMQVLGKGKVHQFYPGYFISVDDECAFVHFKNKQLLSWNKDELTVHNRKGVTERAVGFMFYDKNGDVNFITYGHKEGITVYNPRTDNYVPHLFNGQKKLTIPL